MVRHDWRRAALRAPVLISISVAVLAITGLLVATRGLQGVISAYGSSTPSSACQDQTWHPEAFEEPRAVRIATVDFVRDVVDVNATQAVVLESDRQLFFSDHVRIYDFGESEPVWQYPEDEPFATIWNASASDHYLGIVSGDKLIVFYRHTMSEVWEITDVQQDWLYVSDEYVVIRDDKGAVGVFDTPTGDLRWMTPTWRTSAASFVAGAFLYVVDDSLTAYALLDGQLVYSVPLVAEGQPLSTHLIGDGELLVATSESLHMIDYHRGDVVWNNPILTVTEMRSAAVTEVENRLVILYERSLFTLDRASGDLTQLVDISRFGLIEIMPPLTPTKDGFLFVGATNEAIATFQFDYETSSITPFLIPQAAPRLDDIHASSVQFMPELTAFGEHIGHHFGCAEFYISTEGSEDTSVSNP